MIAVETINLSKKYDGINVVDNLNLKIEENCLYALLGLNGAGKTTSCKMLCGLLKQNDGQIIINGYDTTKDLNKIKPIINISPQESAICLNLTVYENLSLIADIYKITNKKEKIAEICEKLALNEYLTKRCKNLSGGIKRRISIALALITSPKILFLDEPTLGLDVLSRHELWDIIKQLKRQMTIILTTHYLDEVANLADKIGIINKGKLIEEDTLDNLLIKYQAATLEDAFLKIIKEQKYE